jgi:hypothetical protein
LASNGTDPEVIALERAWPDHQVWASSRTLPVPGGGFERVTTWHARRRDGTGGMLTGYSASELAEYLEAKAAR